MATLVIKISKNDDGGLVMDNPPGKVAVELGHGGTIQCDIGSGFSGPAQFNLLGMTQPNTDTRFVLNLVNGETPPIEAIFPNGAVMYLYNNLRTNVYVRNDGTDPTTGEDDLEFYLQIADDDGNHNLDPEIRVRSGTAAETAKWVSATG